MNYDGMISVNGNIENNLKITFQETIHELLRQKQSYLSNTPAVYNAPFNGRVLGIVRAGGVRLKEANERNARLQRQEYLFDNRWTTKKRWANSWIMDNADVMDAIANPESSLYTAITDAINVLKDQVILKAAVGSVKVGGRTYDDPVRILQPEDDGVKEIDATGSYNFDTIKRIKTNFGNNYVSNGITIAQTINEESQLFSDNRLINKDYENGLNVNHNGEGSFLKILNCRFISDFAGSDNGAEGVGKKYDPIIPEIGGFRYCVAMAEKAVQFGLVQIDVRTTPNLEGYVDSTGIDVVVRAHALRLQGEKVQIIKTTI